VADWHVPEDWPQERADHVIRGLRGPPREGEASDPLDGDLDVTDWGSAACDDNG
jgi:hypothetical protein